MRPRPRPRNRGIALIVTLLVIVVLTIAVTAFMQSMALERRTSQAYLNILKADEAARAGLEKATLLISRAIASSTTLDRRTYVTAAYQPKNANGTINTNLAPVTVISSASGDTDVFSAPLPLISRAQPDSDFQRATANPIPTTLGAGFTTLDADRSGANPAVSTVDLNRNAAIEEGAPTNFYRVPLETLSSNSGAAAKTVAAYGFYVSDEQGRICPAYHRSLARNTIYDYPTDASDLPLNLGNDPSTGKPRLFSATAVAALPTSAMLQISPLTIGQAFANVIDYGRIKHLIGGYRTFSEETIPAGYPSAGKPKYDINDLAKNLTYGATSTIRAENIATLLDTELPGFKDRDAALVASGANAAEKKRYLNRLAASIVDYVDTDSTPTQVNGGEPAGRDLFPLVVAVVEKLQRTGIAGPDSNGNYNVVFTSQLYAQVWNPYTTTATGVPRFQLNNRMMVTFGTGPVVPLTDYDQTGVSSSVRPNEMKVLVFPAVQQTFSSPPNVSGPPTPAEPKWASGSPQGTADNTTHLYFKFYWGTTSATMSLADSNRRPPVSPDPATSGLTRLAKSSFSTSTANFQCSFLPSNSPAAGGWRFPGDPRANYLSNYDWGTTISADASYSSSTYWGGRQINTQPRWQDFVTSWAARDYVRANVNFGSPPSNINTTPDAVSPATPSAAGPSSYVTGTDDKNAPAYLRNDEMRSIGELGNIFDPAQADDSGAAPSGGTPPSVFVSAGGRTLRIGQPEFSFWDLETSTAMPAAKIAASKRATNLLDIFTTNKADAFQKTGFPQSQGRINVNTAPKEVLTALFYNLGLTTDQYDSNVRVIDFEGSASLAQFLIDKRPYHKISDLRILTRQLLKGYTPSTGSPKKSYYTPEAPSSPYLEPTTNLDAGVSNSLSMMDRAREEVFNRIMNSVTVQSRAYRIFSCGKVFSPSGAVSAQTSIEAIVELEPMLLNPANPSAIKMTPHIKYIRTVP